MPKVSRGIRQDALPDPESAQQLFSGTEPVAQGIRNLLKSAQDALQNAQVSGASSTAIIKTWTWFVDRLLVTIWRHYTANEPDTDCCSLLAVGGYGRGELHPASDIDLMILVSDRGRSGIASASEQFLHLLWDIGLDVGHSVRTVPECIAESADLTVITNLMESRLLSGSPALFDEMQEALSPARIWPADKFFRAKLVEQEKRYNRFDDTAYKLEPNIKESPGGLRDLQMIGWVTQRHFGSQSLEELVEHGFLTEKEHRSLIRCRNFLWRIRNGLHLLAKRREDRLLFEHQRVLAEQFGYANKEGSLAVEQLMKRYYRTVKELGQLNDILLQHFDEEFIDASESTVISINRRFNSVGGYLETSHDSVFENQPFALMEIYMLLQQNEDLKGIRAGTIRQIQASLHLINRTFRQDLACRSIFIQMFRDGDGLTDVLRKMNKYGVLGAYFPAFGRIVGLMQHDLFHIYTVDVHTLFVLRNLRRLTVPEFADEFPLASKLMRNIFKPERLYLASLLHDIAKGRGGDHSVLGEGISRRFCKLHDMSDFDAGFVAWLVRNHLIMSWTAQRQDTSDPEVIDSFAHKVGSRERLDNLYLLTMADMRGTSPKVWNEWKSKLLESLYHATARALRRGIGSSVDDAERVADRRQVLHEKLVPEQVSEPAFSRYWELFSDDYYLRYNREAIEYHIKALTNAAAIDLPLVLVRYSEQSGSTIVLIFAPEVPRLLINAAAGFDLLNLNIVDARLHTSHTGYALQSYAVLDGSNCPITDDEAMQDIGQQIREQLVNPQKGRDPRKAYVPRSIKQFPTPTRVKFSEDLRGQTTVELVTQDRPGLLYQIANAFYTCRIKLHNARIATFGAYVEDIFVITDLSDNAVTDKAKLHCIEQELASRLDEPETDNAVSAS